MKTEKKNFDLGIYQFHRTIAGPICKDDQEVKDGEIIAVLHPLKKVDPDDMYCFGILKSSGKVMTLVRKNLRFKKVLTLSYERKVLESYAEEIHGKIHVAQNYLETNKQLTL
jgi:hypothetical protein